MNEAFSAPSVEGLEQRRKPFAFTLYLPLISEQDDEVSNEVGRILRSSGAGPAKR